MLEGVVSLNTTVIQKVPFLRLIETLDIYYKIASFSLFSVSKGIDDYILNFEHIDYSSEELHEGHMRHRRSADQPVRLNINAFNR